MKTIELTPEQLTLLLEICDSVAVAGQRVRVLAQLMVKLEHAANPPPV